MSSAREFAKDVMSIMGEVIVTGECFDRLAKAIEQRDADREKELKAQLDELSRYKRAIDFHLCANDKTDWLGCNMDHGGYCDVCESDPEDHQHKRLAKLEAELARYKAACEAGMALVEEWTQRAALCAAPDKERIYNALANELRSVLKDATEGR